MSLDPVLSRHYINVPKPQSRPIPSSLTSTPPRSQTISISNSKSYTRSDLLSISPSPLTATTHHRPPIPATASRIDDVARILASPSPSVSIEKIEKVNEVLRKDSVEFLEGLVRQGKLDPSTPTLTPTTAIPLRPQPQVQEVPVVRSRTLPIPVPAPVIVKKKNNLLPMSHQRPSQSEKSEGWSEFGSMIPEDGSFDEQPPSFKHPKANGQEEILDLNFEIDSTLSPIDIELMSAKRISASPVSKSSAIPISIPTPSKPSGGISASAVFNKSLGSAGLSHGYPQGHGQYTPSSPSPLSLSIAQSLSKRHAGLRNLISSSPIRIDKDKDNHNHNHKGVTSPSPSQGPTTAHSPSVQNVTIVSSPIEDILPWRKSSLLPASAKPTPISSSPPARPPAPAVRKTIGTGSLNAFAPPFPLPNTTPAAPVVARAESSTLPLPSSLPKKPTTILPPVFVKRELAMLPQTMALPDIPPMGDDWIGERSLSGNEKRRRASEFPTSVTANSISSQGGHFGPRSTSGIGFAVGLEGLSRPGSSLTISRSGTPIDLTGGSAPNSRRPQRLVSLGEKLKENINRAV